MAGLIINKISEEKYNKLKSKSPNELYLITDSKDRERLLGEVAKMIKQATAKLVTESTLNKAVKKASDSLRGAILDNIGIVTADLSDLVDGEANTFDLPPGAIHGYMVFVDGVQKAAIENPDRTFTLLESPDEKSELIIKYLSI